MRDQEAPAGPTPTAGTKSDHVHARVRRLILTGGLEPGSVVPQARLAETLGVSTTPLREAMRRLATEGLVTLGAHRDARVAPLTAEEARDLLEVRLALDPRACALAAERRSTEELAAMRTALASCRALPDAPSDADLAAHRAFHRTVYLASHNDVLVATLDGLWDRTDRYRLLGLRSERDQDERDRTDREHAQLVDAVASGDAAAAAEVMGHHVGGSLGARAVHGLAASVVPGGSGASQAPGAPGAAG